jgi:polyisoprenoid-binding protein YceI
MVVSKVRGRFTNWSANISLGSDPTQGSVEATIEANSIDTGVGDRDNHLRAPDFLNVAQFPSITYKSKKVEKLGATEYRLLGDLTILGVTREVPLAVTYGGTAKDPWGNEKALISAHTTIDRKDFGLKWNQVLEAGGVLVGEQIEIEIDVQAVKA